MKSNETIQSIGKLLLGFEDIKLDTSLTDIGWHWMSDCF